MADVFFYHLMNSSAYETMAQLSIKCLKKKWRIYIQLHHEQSLSDLDAYLWETSAHMFLPHGIKGGDYDEKQPILIANTPPNDNTREVLFLNDESLFNISTFSFFKRVCIFFDGHNQTSLTRARKTWKNIIKTEHNAVYWAQENNGRWHEKQRRAGSPQSEIKA